MLLMLDLLFAVREEFLVALLLQNRVGTHEVGVALAAVLLGILGEECLETHRGDALRLEFLVHQIILLVVENVAEVVDSVMHRVVILARRLPLLFFNSLTLIFVTAMCKCTDALSFPIGSKLSQSTPALDLLHSLGVLVVSVEHDVRLLGRGWISRLRLGGVCHADHPGEMLQ